MQRSLFGIATECGCDVNRRYAGRDIFRRPCQSDEMCVTKIRTLTEWALNRSAVFFLSFIFIHSFAGVAGIFMHKCVSEKVTAIIYQCHRRSMYMFIYSCRAHNKWAGRLGSHSHTHRSKSARVMRIYSPCVVRCMRPIRRRRRIWVVPAGAPSQRDIIIINASGTSKAQTTYTYPRHMDRKYAETQFVWCFIFNYHKMWLIEHYLHDLHHLHQIRPYFVLNANGKCCAEPHILICVVCIYRMEFLWYSVSVFRR